MKLRKYTLDQLKDAIANSISICQTLEKLDLPPAGGNYKTFHRAVKYFNLDISHFKGQGWNKGKFFGPKRDIEEYLNNNYQISSSSLRLRLLKEKFFQPKCYSCNLTLWMGNPIPLELEHKDGNHSNNSLDNLTLLCPNCHALTPTYCGKNKGSYKS